MSPLMISMLIGLLVIAMVVSLYLAFNKGTDQAATEAGDGEETVFDDMLQTKDKARGVEDLTLGRKDELDQALEAAEDDASAEE